MACWGRGVAFWGEDGFPPPCLGRLGGGCCCCYCFTHPASSSVQTCRPSRAWRPTHCWACTTVIASSVVSSRSLAFLPVGLFDLALALVLVLALGSLPWAFGGHVVLVDVGPSPPGLVWVFGACASGCRPRCPPQSRLTIISAHLAASAPSMMAIMDLGAHSFSELATSSPLSSRRVWTPLGGGCPALGEWVHALVGRERPA